MCLHNSNDEDEISLSPHIVIARRSPVLHHYSTSSFASSFYARQSGLTIPLSSVRFHHSAVADPASVC
jgi:hypothetical protein